MNVCSFDIFDTCLVRACGYPETVFDMLAERVLGDGETMTALVDFAAERRDGEMRARRALINQTKEDVTISEIYDFCDFSLYSDKDKREIARMEMEIEREVLCPVFSIKEEIRMLHEQNQSVLFISDMYLPEDFILDILKDNGLFEAGDKLYVSSKIRKTKHTGNLFRHVQSDLELKYEEWLHKGDNWHSDVAIPRELGIKAEQVSHKYSRYEKSLINRDVYFNESCLNRVAGISRAVRIAYDLQPAFGFAADFVAPLYVPFVYSILEDAKRKEIKRLFFLARDGYLLYLIAQELSSSFPGIDMQYIYVSRKSLYLPGLDDISEESIRKLFLQHERITVEEVLDRLQMEDYDYSSSHPDSSDRGQEPVGVLLKDKDFIHGLAQRKEEQERLCVKYFEEVGLMSPHSAVVDLAGTRKCHEAINHILNKAGYVGVFGYYLEVLSDRIKGTNYSSLYYLDRFEIMGWRENPLTPQEIFEQYFSITDQCRTISYMMSKDGKVMPVFEEDWLDMEYKRKVFEANKSVCECFAKYYKSIVRKNHEYVCRNSVNVYKEFYSAPSLFYLKALDGLCYSNSRLQSTPVLVKDRFLRVLKRRKRLNWYRAQLVYNSRFPDFVEKMYRFFDAMKK